MEYTGEKLRSELESAKKALKKGKEYSKSSVLSLRFNPDWDSVSRYSRDAATILRRCGAAHATLLLEALEMSARSNEEINAFNQVALDQEEIAALYSKGALGDPAKMSTKTTEAYRAASRFFMLNNQVDRAANSLLLAAKAVIAAGGATPTAAAKASCRELMSDACAVYEDADRAATAEQTFKQTLAFLLKDAGDAEGALELLRRQNRLYARRLDMFGNDLHKNYLSEVVLLLSVDRPQAAREALQRYQDAPAGPALESSFSSSDACSAAGALIDACGGSAEELEAVRKRHSVLKHLDNAVSRIAFKLVATGKGAPRETHSEEAGETAEQGPATSVDAADLLA